jgi:hypothetical protein
MSEFDFTNTAHRKVRAFRTRAIAAQVLANTAAHCPNAEAWAYVAVAWGELAGIIQRSSAGPWKANADGT